MKKTDKEVDLSALSRERLIEMCTSLKKTAEAQEAEIYKLRLALSELYVSNDAKNQTILRDNFNAIITKSEHEPDADGKSLINEAEETAKKKGGRTLGSKNFSLPAEELEKMVGPEDVITIEPDEVLKGDGNSAFVCFGSGSTFKIVRTPALFKVLKIVRPKYRLDGRICQARSDDIFPHSYLSASLAADIVSAKYEMGIPMYRYTGWLNQEKLRFNSRVLSEYAIRTAGLQPR